VLPGSSCLHLQAARPPRTLPLSSPFAIVNEKTNATVDFASNYGKWWIETSKFTRYSRARTARFDRRSLGENDKAHTPIRGDHEHAHKNGKSAK